LSTNAVHQMSSAPQHAHLCFDTDDKGKFDELVEEKGVKLLIDPAALMHVLGTKMDYVEDKLR
jgi:Fe-S cluster assembly iron-binding protein IscA